MVHEPDGAKEYIAKLYQFPRQVIPGISNFWMQGALEFINSDQATKDAWEQRRNFMINRLRVFKDTIAEGLPYKILIQDNLHFSAPLLCIRCLMLCFQHYVFSITTLLRSCRRQLPSCDRL